MISTRTAGLLVTALAMAQFGCARPVFECDPNPTWTATSTRLALDGGYPFLLGVADETVLLYREPNGPSSFAFAKGHQLLELPVADLPVTPSAARSLVGGIVLSGDGDWVTVSEAAMLKGDLALSSTRALTSPAAARIRDVYDYYRNPDLYTPDYQMWASQSRHTFRTQVDVFKLNNNFDDYKVVSADDRIVAGATSPDERFTCVTVEYAKSSIDTPGRYGLHCFEWEARPGGKVQGAHLLPDLMEEAEAIQVFPERVTVVPLTLSDLRYVPADRLELVPLTEYRPGGVTLNVTSTQCGFWADDDHEVYYSSGGDKFSRVPIATEPVGNAQAVRKLVFGPQSAASLIDGLLTQLTTHPFDSDNSH